MREKRAIAGYSVLEVIVVVVALAVVAAVVSPILPRSTRQRGYTRAAQCAANQRQIATTAILYAEEHGGHMPDANAFWTAIGVPEKVLHCPAVKPSQGNSYGYNVSLSRISTREMLDPEETVLISDSDQPSHLLYSWQDTSRRHAGKSVIAYADGHIESLVMPRSVVTPTVSMLASLPSKTISEGAASFSMPRVTQQWAFNGMANGADSKYALMVSGTEKETESRPSLHLHQQGQYAISGKYAITLPKGVHAYAISGYVRINGRQPGVIRIVRGTTDIARIICREDRTKHNIFGINIAPVTDKSSAAYRRTIGMDLGSRLGVHFNLTVANGRMLVELGDRVKSVDVLDSAWDQATSVQFSLQDNDTTPAQHTNAKSNTTDLYLTQLMFGAI
ncbi:MAG TPA: hypothetical protein VHV83_15960 [Armatimonadota bacterium]|nr:hypothetical protein [Armatimonadota bacterium]